MSINHKVTFSEADILHKNHGTLMGLSFIADVVRHYNSERVCHGRVLKFSQTDGIDFV